MKITFELNDAWLDECKMHSFKPSAQHYHPAKLNDGRKVFIIDALNIAPCEKRATLKGVFCDQNSENTARDRVTSILKGFRDKQTIEPIEIKRTK